MSTLTAVSLQEDAGTVATLGAGGIERPAVGRPTARSVSYPVAGAMLDTTGWRPIEFRIRLGRR